MDILSYEGSKRVGLDNVLVKVDKLIDRQRFSVLMKTANLRKKLGQTGYDPLLLFKFRCASHKYHLVEVEYP